MNRRKLLSALPLLALVTAPLEARVVRVEATAPSPVKPVEGQPAYEQISGVFYGELDPRDQANKVIVDLDKAPRNRAGKVEYSASFTLTRPVDPARRSGVLQYHVPNRGFQPQLLPDGEGHVFVASGWQGDIPEGPNTQWIKVPIARGQSGMNLVRMVKVPAGTKSRALGAGQIRPTPRPVPTSLDPAKNRLTLSLQGQPDRDVPASEWAFADCTKAEFPGTPDPSQLCLKAGFDPNAAYTLSYAAKDPQVLGIGFAATRDLVSFLRSGQPDAAGSANPAGGPISWTVGVGDSQSGNYLRSFVHLGFNADEAKARVFDGINPNIAARQLVLNLRFGNPGEAGGLYRPGSEGTLWWGRYDDKVRKLGASSLLDRCTQAKVCPKVVETFGSAEIWGLRASPGLVGTDARGDIALPANVRRYYFPSVTHAGSFTGGFPLNGEAPRGSCALRGNPNSSREAMRVARRALVDWVKTGKEPPASRYPTLANGDLVEPVAAAMGWPAIKGAPAPDGHILAFNDYDFGKGFIAKDVSGVPSKTPALLRGTLPQRVPRVNADGNETAGVPSVQLLVPLGTYTGWNVETQGYEAGQNCGFEGGFIPFAKTRAERLAKGDPRLSLQERYGTHQGFVSKVLGAIGQLQKEGWLLPDDAGRIYEQAENSAVLK